MTNQALPRPYEECDHLTPIGTFCSECEIDKLIAERDALAVRVRELEAQNEAQKNEWLSWNEKRVAFEQDAARYQFIRSGGAYIEPTPDGEIYMATDTAGKYYDDLRDFDMDIDEAIAALTTPESKP